MKYYLYRHVRLDTNEIFYIGIGSKSETKNFRSYKSEYKRAFSKSEGKRSLFWKRVTNKSPYIVEIVLESDSLDFIKQKEVEFIKLYGRKDLGLGTLVNLTDGGEGTINRIVSNKNKEAVGRRASKKAYIYNIDGTFIEKYKSFREAKTYLGIEDFATKWCKSRREDKCIYLKGYLFSKEDLGPKIKEHDKYAYSDKFKVVDQYTKDNKYVQSFKSIKEAAISVGNINCRMDISKCCYGRRKSAYGFKWKHQL